MHVWVTGADGFVGRALVERLLGSGLSAELPLTRLTAIDQRFGAAPVADPRLFRLEGDFADPTLVKQASATAPDVVFHLASVPGSRAESEPALGLQVNLLAPIALFQHLAQAGFARPPRVVFASSVAVYGPLPEDGSVDEDAATRPTLSYGAHKRMTELLLADLARRGELDAVSLRLPGIVARPLPPTGHGSAFTSDKPTGHGSAFMSDAIHRLLAGAAFDCPVGQGASIWWMSLGACIDNLLHAAAAPSWAWRSAPVVQLPVLTATMGELVATIERQTGRPAAVTWRPDARTEALFGRQPRLATPRARGLGFTDDASLDRLLRRAVEAPAFPPPKGSP